MNKILEEEPTNYAGSFKTEILVKIEDMSEESLRKLFSFAELNSENEIRDWVDKLTSRIVMHEHEDVVGDIIDDYFVHG